MHNHSKSRLLALLLALSGLATSASAENWNDVDTLVQEFAQISAQISRGDLQAAESELQALGQRIDPRDSRLAQSHRALAEAHLRQARQQLQAGNATAARSALSRGQSHLDFVADDLRQQYQASQTVLDEADSQARRQQEAADQQARQAAERAEQQRLAEEKARAAREAQARQQAAAAAAKPVTPPPPSPPRAHLIDPAAASSSVPMPMLDAGDRDALRDLLDGVAADVVAFNCAVRVQVREAKDFPFVAALLSARVKKLDPQFEHQFAPLLKPDEEPRLVLSPQGNS